MRRVNWKPSEGGSDLFRAITPPPPLNEIFQKTENIRDRISWNNISLPLNEISGDAILRSRCGDPKWPKVTFWGFQNLCYSLWKQQSAPLKITKVINWVIHRCNPDLLRPQTHASVWFCNTITLRSPEDSGSESECREDLAKTSQNVFIVESAP